MERIVIEVEDSVAEKWQRISPKIKIELKKSFEKQIDVLADDIKHFEFKVLLDKVSEEAERNGLTEEILQQLLNDE